MRRLLLGLLLLSPATFALVVTDVRYTNVREGSAPGLVTTDLSFTIDYRNLASRLPEVYRQRWNCAPSIKNVFARVYDHYSSESKVFMEHHNVPISAAGNRPVRISEVVTPLTPEREVINTRLTDVTSGKRLTVAVSMDDGAAESPNGCNDYDFTELSTPGEEIPRIRPDCSIELQSGINHGGVVLNAVGDQHIASGGVQVTCDAPADITVSTGHTGSIKINDTLSTDISIDGSPNSVTRTINGIQLLPVTSRLHRTSAGSWAGPFSHPVILTITWP